MDTQNEKTIAELIQELSNTVLDCLKRNNGDGSCFIDENSGESFEEYWFVIMAVCSEKQIDISAIDLKECFIKANEKAAFQFKEETVSKILEEFINSCSWTPFMCNKEITIPYTMNTEKYTKDRENIIDWTGKKGEDGKVIIEGKEKKIKRYEGGFRDKFKPSEYNFQDYNTETNGSTRYGKGSPDMIRYVIDKLIENKAIASNSNEVVQFMKDYAIGIDCSGFVTRAVATVLEKLKVDKENQFLTIGHPYPDGEYLLPDCSCMASDAFIIDKEIETKEFIREYNNKKEKEKEKEKKKELTQNYKLTGNSILSNVRVGDIICIFLKGKVHYHVKIIYKIDRNDKGFPEKLYFAESSSINDKGVTTSYDKEIPVKIVGKDKISYTVVRPYYMDIYYHGQYGTHLNK